MAWLTRVWQWIADSFELNAVAAVMILGLFLYRTWLLHRAPAPTRPSARARALASGSGNSSWDTFETMDAGLWIVVLLYLLVRPHVATIVEVTSPTMAPTLQGSPTPQIDGPNDRVLVSRYLYHLRAPQRGEIVAWKPDDGEPGQLDVGRLVALAGDQIRIDGSGRVHVNDDFVAAAQQNDRPEQAPVVTIPEGCLLALGDERAAPDGRIWLVDGYLRDDQLAGKATAVIWPPDRVRLLD